MREKPVNLRRTGNGFDISLDMLCRNEELYE